MKHEVKRSRVRYSYIGLPTKKAALNLRAGFAIAGINTRVEIFRAEGWHYVKFRHSKLNDAVWAGYVCHWRGGYYLSSRDPRSREVKS